MDCRQIIFTGHARKRLFVRGISVDEVRRAIEHGENVEDYPEDKPYPSMLILGWIDQKPVHIVLARVATDGICIIVTVYSPDPQKWEPGFKKRKKT
jgi:hypothetical protein